METTRLSTKGQIVLPAELRRQDRIRPGQEFDVPSERIEGGTPGSMMSFHTFQSMETPLSACAMATAERDQDTRIGHAPTRLPCRSA